MKQTMALIVSVLLGLVAVFAMNSYIKKEQKKVTKGMDLIEIAVATRPLSVGAKINADMFKSNKIPVNFYISDMIKMREVASYLGKEIGRNITRNKLILKTDIRRTTVKLSHSVEVGERLVTVSVTKTSGVAGLIKPRSKVDIFHLDGNSSQVLLLLSRVRVYAVDNRSDPRARSNSSRGGSYSSLTLVVSPEEAALLMAAEANGELIFTLRNDHDPSVITTLVPMGMGSIQSQAKKLNGIRAGVQK